MKIETRTSLMVAVTIAGCLLIAGASFGEDGEGHEGWNLFRRKLDVAPVSNELYKKECGTCHFAYQPGLLPARSWKTVMGGLESHFGGNAELPVEDRNAIMEYLVKNSADNSKYKASIKIFNSIPNGETPVAISKTAYFLRKHDEIPPKMVTGNPQVKSFSHCARCHVGAEKGSYNEHKVNIPGFGRFED